MRLGKNEREVLRYIDITSGDVLLGFLTSAGSSYLMYKNARRFAQNREKRKEEQRRWKDNQRKLVDRLKKKRLIRLVPQGEDVKVEITNRAAEYLVVDRVRRGVESSDDKWDGLWTLIMFDVPTQEQTKRVRLAHVLQKVGFIQVQLSNYVYPYDVPELYTFLRENPRYGEYCQVFRGKYKGDDSNLKQEFGLD